MGLASLLGAGEPHWHGWGHHSLGPAAEPQGQPRAPQTIASVSSQHWVPEHKKPLAGVPVYPKAPDPLKRGAGGPAGCRKGLWGAGQSRRAQGRSAGCRGTKTRAWLVTLGWMGPQRGVRARQGVAWTGAWCGQGGRGVAREGLSPKFPRLFSRVLTHISSMLTSRRSSTWARARCRNR